jgi:hypothetical protein
VTLAGDVYVVASNHGSLDLAEQAGTFVGTDAVTGTQIAGVFTCLTG